MIHDMLISGLVYNKDMETFGSKIAEKRKEKGLTQKDLAEKIKKEDGNPISPQYLIDFEPHSPTSMAMSFSIQYFLSWSGKTNRCSQRRKKRL